MSIFTIILIGWVIYQVFLALMKKERQAGRQFERMKLPDSPFLREVIQKSAPGFPQTMKAWPLDYIQTEGTQGIEGTQGSEGIQGVEGTQGSEGRPEMAVPPWLNESGTYAKGYSPKEMPLRSDGFALSQEELLRGIVLAEVLGKPRALRPCKGPRS